MNDSFVLGKDVVPVWFNEEANKGRVRTIYDDNRNVQNIIINSGIKKYVASPGDTIVNSKSGIVVIPKKVEVKEEPVVKETKEEAEEENPFEIENSEEETNAKKKIFKQKRV